MLVCCEQDCGVCVQFALPQLCKGVNKMGEKRGMFEGMFDSKQTELDKAVTLGAVNTEMLAEVKSNVPLTEGEIKKLGKTVIGANCVFEGKLKTNGNVEVLGKYEGDMEADGQVLLHTDMKGNITASMLELDNCKVTGELHVEEKTTVSRESNIIGDVYTKRLVCFGKIKGNLFVKDETTLDATAEITGDIKTGTMSVAKGARIDGHIDMA